jgi:hypothetical protein
MAANLKPTISRTYSLLEPGQDLNTMETPAQRLADGLEMDGWNLETIHTGDLEWWADEIWELKSRGPRKERRRASPSRSIRSTMASATRGRRYWE